MVAIGGAARVVSRDRRGGSYTQSAFRVAGIGNGMTRRRASFCVVGVRNRVR